MPKLVDVVAEPRSRKTLIDDCVVLIDEEVSAKSGLSGIAVRAGYAVVKGVKPGFVADSVDSLLDDFAKALQPIADEASERGVRVSEHLLGNRPRVAEALLGITDARALRSRHRTVKAAYERLRPSAKKHVEEAVPRLSKLVEKHVNA